MLAGIDGDEQRQLWRILAALLHISSIGGDDDSGQAAFVDACTVPAVLLGLQSNELAASLLPVGARKRVACVSTIYGALFDWLVHRIGERSLPWPSSPFPSLP